MIDKTLLIRQLKTIQNMIDTLLLSMVEEDCKPIEDKSGECECGEELVSFSTLGKPDKWMCVKCGKFSTK